MNKARMIFVSALALVLLLGLVSGCDSASEIVGGDGAELEAAREMIEDLEKQLGEAQDEAGTLLQQIMELGEESGLAGDTPEETAKNIVEQYHKTHTYSMTDLFVCADMAMDVWNMLKAQGIDAVIQIGSVQNAVLKMEDSEHAWVIANVGGKQLALETTSGKAVTKAENSLYYTGWSFDSPAKYKEFEELKYEHNLRVDFYNSLIKEAENVYALYQAAFAKYENLRDEYNSTYAGQPASEASDTKLNEVNAQLNVAKELEGRYNQLQTLLTEQQAELEKIPPKMQALTS